MFPKMAQNTKTRNGCQFLIAFVLIQSLKITIKHIIIMICSNSFNESQQDNLIKRNKTVFDDIHKYVDSIN